MSAGPLRPPPFAAYRDYEHRAMTVSKTAAVETAKEAGKEIGKEIGKASRPARKEPAEGGVEGAALELGELSELLGYSLKRAQLKVFEDFLRCVEPLQLTPAQFSVLLLLDKNPGRNQTEIANTLGILRPNFVAMLDGLESRDLCTRMRSTNDRRSHILVLTDKGRAVLARAKKLVAAKHEARLNDLLGPANRAALLDMLATIAKEF
jgi:DNA-binding MarR family transcriptional regulator